MSSISSVGGTSTWSQTSATRGNRPPPTDGGDPAAMFKKIDTDGSGTVDATELQNMFTNMASKSGDTSGTSSTPDASKLIKEFDADGDGSLNQDEMGKAMQSLTPPTNTMDFARHHSHGAGKASGSNASADSSQQTMQDLLSAVDTNQDGTIDKSELDKFKQIATEEADSLTKTDSAASSTSSSSSSTSSDSSSSSSSSESTSRQTSMEELARMVIQRYASMAATTTQSTLSVAA